MIASEPQIKGSPSARLWKVSFLDQMVKITVNRLVDEPKSLWGEWTIKANFPGVPYPWAQIHHEGMNLLTGAAKKRTAKVLHDRYANCDWPTMIDKTAELVIQKHRQGEPVIQLKDLPPKESLSYRLAPLLLENQVSLIYSEGGKGKSLVSQYFACLVAEGYPVGSLEPEPGPVLICDYETDQATASRNLAMIHKGLGIEDGSSIFYRRMGQPLVSEIESIQAQVLEHGIQFVIVDSAAPAVGNGGAQGDELVLKYFGALRNLNVTSLTIAHRAKNSDNGPFGSVFWGNIARNVYRLQSESETPTRLHVGLFNEKTNDKKRPPFGLCVDFADDKITFTEENPKTRPEMMEHLSLGDQLEAIIKDGKGRPWTVKDLAEDLGENMDSIRTTLHRGKKRFTQLADGGWGLAVIGEHNGHNITPPI